MKKSVACFFAVVALFILAEPCKAAEFNGGAGVFSFSNTLETTKVNDQWLVGVQGLGISVPLLFNGERTSKFSASYFMIEPAAAVEYQSTANLLRIRAGLHFGPCAGGIGIIAGYYAGLSGLFMNDFRNGTTTGGASLEIGFEMMVFFMGFKCQLQYDFYANSKYNGLVWTIAVCAFVPFS